MFACQSWLIPVLLLCEEYPMLMAPLVNHWDWASSMTMRGGLRCYSWHVIKQKHLINCDQNGITLLTQSRAFLHRHLSVWRVYCECATIQKMQGWNCTCVRVSPSRDGSQETPQKMRPRHSRRKGFKHMHQQLARPPTQGIATLLYEATWKLTY